MKLIFIARAGTAVVCAVSATPALAGGFNLDHQNAAALGAAFAGAEAAPADAGYAAHNPATMTGIESGEVNATITGVFPSAKYSSADATLLGVAPVAGATSGDGVTSNAFVPNLSIAVPLTDRLTIGAVVNATFGLKTDFASDSVIRYQAQASELTVIEATPMAAFEVTPNLSVGAGLRIQHMDLSLTSVIDAGGVAAANLIPGFQPGGSDLSASFDVTDIAIGYTVGMQAKLSPRFRAGLSYASKINHSLDGDARFDLASSAAAQILNGAAGLFAADRFSADFATPATAALGVRFDAADRLTLLASARLMFWSSFDVVTLTFNDGATPAEVLTQNWKDSWLLSVGGEYAAGERTTLRAGFMFDESPVNAEFASPRVPDGDRYWLAAGLTQSLSDKLSADIGLAYAFFSDRPIDLDGAAPENLFRGSLTANFESEAFAASLRLRYKF